jgi:hypothetical protein
MKARCQEPKPTSRLRQQAVESISRQKGREQRKAAEKGRTLGFFAKEVAKRVLNPVRRSPKIDR